MKEERKRGTWRYDEQEDRMVFVPTKEQKEEPNPVGYVLHTGQYL